MKRIKMLLYVCKDKRGYLHIDNRKDTPRNRKYYLSPDSSPFGTYESDNYLNGKIVASFDWKVEKIERSCEDTVFTTKSLGGFALQCRSYLNANQIYKYQPNYAIHIENLKEFDKPRELSYYWKNGKKVDRAPQNMMIVQDIYESYVNVPNKNETKNVHCVKIDEYIVISVKPTYACLILNKIKTVELRRTILKEMLK